MIRIFYAIWSLMITAALILPDFPAWVWLLAPLVLMSVHGITLSRVYTYRWLMMALALPLMLGLMELVANPLRRFWSASLVFCSVCLFISLALGLRTARQTNR